MILSCASLSFIDNTTVTQDSELENSKTLVNLAIC